MKNIFLLSYFCLLGKIYENINNSQGNAPEATMVNFVQKIVWVITSDESASAFVINHSKTNKINALKILFCMLLKFDLSTKIPKNKLQVMKIINIVKINI